VSNLRLAYWNLTTEALYEEAVFRGEGVTSRGGPFIAHTGKHTARSANDKFVVRHTDSEDNIWWGVYNRPFEIEKFDALYARLLGYLQGKDVFVQDVYAGADEQYRLPVRFVTEHAWHGMFIRNMFINARIAGGIQALRPGLYDRCRARFQIRPGGRQHQQRDVHHPQLREETCHRRQYAVRRGTEEIGLHPVELPAPAAGRALDALLGERQPGRHERRGFVLRLERDRQNDPVRRPDPPPDRRRRARLER
jgi:hypothetical protein